jgi:long-chain acyl-CoA synthetase
MELDMADSLNRGDYPQTICGLIFAAAHRHPEKTALVTKDASGGYRSITYRELISEVEKLGCGFLALGVSPGTKAALISENRYEWIICDLALLSIGAVDVPRSSRASKAEVEFIINHSECEIVIAETDSVVESTLPDLSRVSRVKHLITIESSSQDLTTGISELAATETGSFIDQFYRRLMNVTPDDRATIIYTSGTTAKPKGVVLSHANIAHNMRTLPGWVGVGSDDTYLSILPPWHAFERTVEYTALSTGATIAYSRPVPGVMLDDMRKVGPTVIVAVPRIWQAFRDAIVRTAANAPTLRRKLFDAAVGFGTAYFRFVRVARDLEPESKSGRRGKLASSVCLTLLAPFQKLFDLLIYRKIRKAAGGNVKLAISGGGALPRSVEEFFSACNFPLVEGYGLTEAAPIVACRRFMKDASFTVGKAVPETELRIVNDEGESLPPGKQGEVLVRGPQVMSGYHKLSQETGLVIDSEGWLHTGDLGILTTRDELRITGRKKDTIVLISGENVEPEPLEEILKESKYIEHVVLVGDDRDVLGALVVPNIDAFKHELNELGERIAEEQRDEFGEMKRIVAGEIKRLICEARGFKRHERIVALELLKEEFKVGEELTMTQKVKRSHVVKKFASLIDEMYSKRKER